MLQKDIIEHRLERIKTWKKMMNKLREKFFPIDYQQSVCRQVQNLRQKDTSVRDYS